jgi:nucleoside 2-deoxyribosyltransferase
MYMKDRDMWNNVCVYMLCCKQGIALLESYSKQEYNPNVAIEYGFMRALNKRVLLLRDKQFPRDRADITGKEMLPFDINNKDSISRAMETWLKEL